MKKISFAFICLILILSPVCALAAGPDTTATASYYLGGKETKGTVSLYKQDYHNEGIPAEILAEEFTKEDGKRENIDFKHIDSIRVGNLLFAKSRYSEGLMSSSEDQMSLVRMLYSGSKASVYFAYVYDKKAQTYSKSLLVDKVNEKKPVDVQRGLWLVMFKKQLTKLFQDCEAVSKKAAEKFYGDGKAAIISATKDYNESCN